MHGQATDQSGCRVKFRYDMHFAAKYIKQFYFPFVESIACCLVMSNNSHGSNLGRNLQHATDRNFCAIEAGYRQYICIPRNVFMSSRL